MARKCKCKVCKSNLMSDEAFCITINTTSKPKNIYYCNEEEYRKEQSEIYFWKQCQLITDEILGYPIINNQRNKLLSEILNSGYTREELYDCIKEQANYISECLGYRSDIDTEYGRLCYMFAIIKGSIKDITDRNRRNKHIEDIKREEVVEIVEEHYEEVVISTNKRKTLLSRLKGV